MAADPAVTGLDLISDAQPPGLAHEAVNLRQIAFGQKNLSGHARAGFGDKPGNANAFALQLADDVVNVTGIFAGGLRIV